MPDIIKRDWRVKVAGLLFLLLTVWWFLSPSYQGPQHERFFGDFPSIYGMIALFGAIWGLAISRKWGGFKSIMGKAIIFFSLGLLAQVFGQLVYAYYSFYKNIAIPYPSLGDLGYFGSIPLYTYGVFLLGRASGVKFSLKSSRHQLLAFLIPAIMLIFTYIIFLQHYEMPRFVGKFLPLWLVPVTIFLDFGYPLGEAIYISLALLAFLLSRKILGGVMKYKILILLLALSIQYLCDFTFLYQVSKGTYVSGGINDLMYLISYFVMTLGLLELDVRSVNKNLETK